MTLSAYRINRNSISKWPLRYRETINQTNTERRLHSRDIEEKSSRTTWRECITWITSNLKLFNRWTWFQFKLTSMWTWATHRRCQRAISTRSRIRTQRRQTRTRGTAHNPINRSPKSCKVSTIHQRDPVQLGAPPVKFSAWAWTIAQLIKVFTRRVRVWEWISKNRIEVINDLCQNCKKPTNCGLKLITLWLSSKTWTKLTITKRHLITKEDRLILWMKTTVLQIRSIKQTSQWLKSMRLTIKKWPTNW